MFAGASPYDYNSSVVKSLVGKRCHTGQICGLGSSIYSHRLRYAISELCGIPSTNITGFVLENTNKLIEPYWQSITINGLSVEIVEKQNINQPISNNASHIKYPRIRIKHDETMREHKYLISSTFLYKR